MTSLSASLTDRVRVSWRHLLLAIFILRLLYLPLFCSLTDLAGDESYYWEWGRRPDWGYYSKPPMIGWLMGLVGQFTGHAEWGIRLAALLCGTLTLAFLALLASRMFGSRAAVLTVLFAALTPANAALSLFFTIDAPLLLCWSAALLAFWRCLERPERITPWCLLALALGLGILSKQMMLVFPVLMLVYAALSPGTRPLLRLPALWICLLTALAFLVPVLLWQTRHGWITLEHTREHFHAAEHLTVGRWFVRLVTFPATQALLFTPVTWGLIVIASLGGLWRWGRMDARQRYLVIFSAPALVVFCLLAMRQSVNPNWPATFYLSAMVLVAGCASQAQFSARLVKTALWTGLAFTVLAYLVPVAGMAARSAGWNLPDPMRRLRGWSESGEQAGGLLARTPRPERTFVLALGHRENASQFAFYIPQHPRVYRWQPDGRVASQYELWPGMQERLGDDALILQPTEKPLPASLVRRFRQVEAMGLIETPLGRGESRRWQVFLGRELVDPAPVPRKTP